MKYLAGAAALVSLAVCANPAPPPRPPADLRQALQQYHPGSAPPPRQLTPVERAELRRQLAESVLPPPRRR